jgi:hypothetical protein
LHPERRLRPYLEKNNVLVCSRQYRYNGDLPTLTPEQINDIHCLHWAEKWPLRKIARHLHIGRRTIAKYLQARLSPPTRRDRASKRSLQTGHHRSAAARPHRNAPVIAQRLRPLGYDGGFTIIKDYLRAVSPGTKNASRGPRSFSSSADEFRPAIPRSGLR